MIGGTDVTDCEDLDAKRLSQYNLKLNITDCDGGGVQVAPPTPQTTCPCPPRRVPHSDVRDSGAVHTVGVTESTPYGCQFCDKAAPGSATSRAHEQVSTNHSSSF
ncbi:hypothetical protein CEXT_734521 [Caerostris extrusa]|uniref:Uncharacterized protein n=1 Tax=Caerostris extrusa TaxID=172846 RepID=A0AAV4Y1W5_CAEEX|nr:hypothetical protein CEXT_734521 [Caerostris extrusa]